MTDIAVLHLGTIVNYQDNEGNPHTGMVIGRLMNGHLEGEVDLDKSITDPDHMPDLLKVQFQEVEGSPPMFPSVTCGPDRLDVVEIGLVV